MCKRSLYRLRALGGWLWQASWSRNRHDQGDLYGAPHQGCLGQMAGAGADSGKVESWSRLVPETTLACQLEAGVVASWGESQGDSYVFLIS